MEIGPGAGESPGDVSFERFCRSSSPATVSPATVSSSPVTTDQLIDQRIDEARRALWWG